MLLQSAIVDSKEPAFSSSFYEHATRGQTSNLWPEIERPIESVNLPLGTAVLHIAFPFIPTDSSQHNSHALPALLTDSIVAAMACSDASVRLITLPLAPPSVRVRENAEGACIPSTVGEQESICGEHIRVISGGTNHQSIPSCVSITLAPSSASLDSDLEMDEDETRPRRDISNRRRVTSKSRSRSRSAGRDNGWDLIIASSSSDLSGLLLIHKITLSSGGRELSRTTTDFNVPLSIQHLPCPAVSLDFNPSLPGDGRNSRLLLAETKGMIRILDCLLAETYNECPCLITLHTSCHSSSHGRRSGSHVLDARWVLGGKAALVLLESGEWGVWDLEGHGPKTQSTSNAPLVPTLGSLFAFATRGLLNDGSNNVKSDNADTARMTKGSKPTMLAPTTPSTRRSRQENLFAGPIRYAERPARGGISVAADQHSKIVDIAVMMWYNDTINIIPSFRTHWADNLKGSGNLFGNGARGKARTLNDILPGERPIDVALLPASHQSMYGGARENTVLVTGETRYVLVTSPSTIQRTTPRNHLSLRSDQQMLEEGELDLDGMQRMLSTMDKRTGSKQSSANGIHQRKIGFVDV